MPMLTERPRRNRSSEALRGLMRETSLSLTHLIAPLFVCEGQGRREPVKSLPGVFRLSLDLLIQEARLLWSQGCRAFLLFAQVPFSQKDPFGQEALNPSGLLPSTIRALKDALPEAVLFSDVALDPYTSHGHDGLVNDRGEILNDATVEQLVEMALVHAEAGVTFVAPSDMMDGRVKQIRLALDAVGHTQVGILSYAAKYASSLYGPFREVLGSQLQFGNKKSYQMDPANRREALREALLDVQEGADILMVKPAGLYLDVISDLRASCPVPVAAYQVSGEYAMIQAAAANGWLDGPAVLLESLIAIRRAGADMIVTYGCSQLQALRQLLESLGR